MRPLDVLLAVPSLLLILLVASVFTPGAVGRRPPRGAGQRAGRGPDRARRGRGGRRPAGRRGAASAGRELVAHGRRLRRPLHPAHPRRRRRHPAHRRAVPGRHGRVPRRRGRPGRRRLGGDGGPQPYRAVRAAVGRGRPRPADRRADRRAPTSSSMPRWRSPATAGHRRSDAREAVRPRERPDRLGTPGRDHGPTGRGGRPGDRRRGEPARPARQGHRRWSVPRAAARPRPGWRCSASTRRAPGHRRGPCRGRRARRIRAPASGGRAQPRPPGRRPPARHRPHAGAVTCLGRTPGSSPGPRTARSADAQLPDAGSPAAPLPAPALRRPAATRRPRAGPAAGRPGRRRRRAHHRAGRVDQEPHRRRSWRPSAARASPSSCSATTSTSSARSPTRSWSCGRERVVESGPTHAGAGRARHRVDPPTARRAPRTAAGSGGARCRDPDRRGAVLPVTAPHGPPPRRRPEVLRDTVACPSSPCTPGSAWPSSAARAAARPPSPAASPDCTATTTATVLLDGTPLPRSLRARGRGELAAVQYVFQDARAAFDEHRPVLRPGRPHARYGCAASTPGHATARGAEHPRRARPRRSLARPPPRRALRRRTPARGPGPRPARPAARPDLRRDHLGPRHGHPARHPRRPHGPAASDSDSDSDSNSNSARQGRRPGPRPDHP